MAIWMRYKEEIPRGIFETRFNNLTNSHGLQNSPIFLHLQPGRMEQDMFTKCSVGEPAQQH